MAKPDLTSILWTLPTAGQGLSLVDLAEQAQCSTRRIRFLIQSGLVARQSTQGKGSTYTVAHVRQAIAANQLLATGKYTVGELAELLSPEHAENVDLALRSAETSPRRALSSNQQLMLFGGLSIITSAPVSPSGQRVIAAVIAAVRSVLLGERERIRAARSAANRAARRR